MVETYEYRDETGEVRRRKLRWEPGFKGRAKSFTWKEPDGRGGWTKSKGGGNPGLLYHSESLPAARESKDSVLVVEGEKDADRAQELGLVAVCNPEGGGRGKWKEKYSEQLRGLDVVVIPDKDAPGRAHAAAVAKSLQDVAASVLMLELPGDGVKDLSDWVSAELALGKSHDEIRLGLESLTAEAPEWDPDDHPEEDEQESETDPTKGQRPTQSEILLQVVDSGGVELFHTSSGEPFALLPVDDHKEVWSVDSKSFQSWLRSRYWAQTGKAANSQSLADVRNTLTARAQFDGEEHAVYTRVASKDGAIYLDLCNSAWEAVEITSSGWRVVAKPPVRFQRTPAMESLPHPVKGGSLSDLRPLVNIRDDHSFALLGSFLVGILRPRGPYPVLVIVGEQGSAKSTLERFLRALVDPTGAPLRTLPRNERDLMISAARSWVLTFDNLSGLKDWQSDAFCRLATGGGFATRELYTNAEEIIFSAQRPVILNGIDEVVGRQDLTDRSISLKLPTIPDDRRRREDELMAEFEELRPSLLGALLDAVSCALRRQSTVQLDSSPRMADFAHWAVAAEPALPWPEGTFLEAYERNRQEAVEASLEADAVACALQSLVEEKGVVEATCQELLEELTSRLPERAKGSRGWPKSPRGLSSRVDRAAPGLRQIGIELDRFREPGSGRRLIRLVQTKAARDRHNRHNRHKSPSEGASARDGHRQSMTVDSPDRHAEDAGSTGLRDGCDGRDGRPPMDDEEALRI